MNYQHTQINYWMRSILIIIILHTSYIVYKADAPAHIAGFLALIFIIVSSFTSLKITVSKPYLTIKFGWGIYSKSFKLSEIKKVKTVKNKWYYGWGIRWCLWPRMTIFNIAGFDAVELKMKNGKLYRIGTNEPRKLEQAIKTKI